MPTVTPALRFEVLQALARASERVAHGAPTLHAAFHYQHLTERAWAQVNKALDDVRFTVPPAQLVEVALSEGGQSAEGRELRDNLAAAQGNSHLFFGECKANPEGLSRAQCVALLFVAREFLKRLPVVSAGPLLLSLPLTRSKDT